MKKWFAAIAALMACCTFVHRSVIYAMVTSKPMPKAPKWHVWVKPEDRRA